jgi:glucose/arabinose dehydrogenase
LRWPSGLGDILQPHANHNAGNLVFGPDGYLYVGISSPTTCGVACGRRVLKPLED